MLSALGWVARTIGWPWKRSRDHAWTVADGEAEAASAELPIELLSHVFCFLDVRDRCVASAVCQRWRSAALDQPLSTNLSLLVSREGQRPPPGGVAPGLSDPALVLRLPVCRDLLDLTIVVRVEPDRVEPGIRRVLASAPGSVQRLTIIVENPYGAARSREVIYGERAADRVAQALGSLPLAHRLPELRELHLLSRQADELVLHGLDQTAVLRLRHPRLECLHATVFLDGALMPFLAALPSLRAVRALSLGHTLTRVGPEALAQLAARGLACASLELTRADLETPAAAAAASGLLRPAALPAGGPSVPEPPPGHARLSICLLPDVWPEGAFAGAVALELTACTLRPLILRWLVSGAHVRTLRSLAIDCVLQGVTPSELLEALCTLPETVQRIRLTCQRNWSPQSLVEGLSALATDPPAPPALRLARLELLPGKAGAQVREAVEAFGEARRAARQAAPTHEQLAAWRRHLASLLR